MNNSQNNVRREVKIDTHAWNDIGFYCNHKEKKIQKWLPNGALRDTERNN